MRTNLSPNAPRRALRASAVAVGFALTTLAAPALASPPDTWGSSRNGPLLNDLLFLIGIPLAVVAVVTLLTYLPSLIRSQSSEGEPSFRDSTEWFGGPRRGVDAAADAEGTREESSSKGGASASW